jgi:O-methyltransferase domain
MRHRLLSATVVDLPVVAEMAGDRIAAAGAADRIDVVAADALRDPLPRDHDVFLVANLLHYYTPDTNRDLLRRIRVAAADGAKLLLADFWTDPPTPSPCTRPSWPGSSRCTFATATSTASTR